MDRQNTKAVIESILFAMGDSVHIDRICEALEMGKKEVEAILEIMQTEYINDKNRGIKILRFDENYQLCTKTEYYSFIRSVAEKRSKNSLSNAALEVLSIVAYNQPVTRSSIEFIRGVDSTYSVTRLLERGFIDELGRAETPGRPILYGTTTEFLRCFGIKSLEELPPLPEKQNPWELCRF